MKNLKILKAALAVLCICMGSCMPDETSRSVLLTKSRWKLTALTVTPELYGSEDKYFECNQDDIVVFNKDFSFTFYDGKTICDSSYLGLQSGRWWLEGETFLELSFTDGYSDTWSIMELEKNTLTLWNFDQTPGVNWEPYVCHATFIPTSDPIN